MSQIWVLAFILQWLLLILLTVVLAGVLRYLAAFQERMQMAAPVTSVFELGQKVVEFQLPDHRGTIIDSEQLIRKAPKSIILLTTVTCPSCRTLFLKLHELSTRADWASDGRAQVIVLLADVTSDLVEQVLAEYPGLAQGVTLLFDKGGRTTTRFGATSFPTGLCVDRDGRVLDQSKNPHASWIYKVLGMLPPVEPINLGQYEYMVAPRISLAD